MTTVSQSEQPLSVSSYILDNNSKARTRRVNVGPLFYSVVFARPDFVTNGAETQTNHCCLNITLYLRWITSKSQAISCSCPESVKLISAVIGPFFKQAKVYYLKQLSQKSQWNLPRRFMSLFTAFMSFSSQTAGSCPAESPTHPCNRSQRKKRGQTMWPIAMFSPSLDNKYAALCS